MTPSLAGTRDLRRYSRHLLIPEVGLGGQEKLAAARVLVVGAGGLGSPILAYLAAAGVGRIGIVDDDTVDVTNLQRQILYATADVGRPKAATAAGRLARAQPADCARRPRRATCPPTTRARSCASTTWSSTVPTRSAHAT